MAWYDLFARVYDQSLEPVYRDQRRLAAEALDVRADSVVLDLPCGTGQSFPALIGPLTEGRLVGMDLSAGMLREAAHRASSQGWTQVVTLQADARTVTEADLSAVLGAGVRPDRLHIFLGMSVFPRMEETFQNLWSLLAPGGRCVIADVHSPRLNLQGRMVNALAQADIRRRSWEPLEAVGIGFERRPLPVRWEHGGEMFVATARKGE